MTRPFGRSAKALLMSAPFSVALRLPVPALRISTSASPPLIRSGWLESTLIVGPVLAGSFASEKDARPVARKTRTTPTFRPGRAPTAACMALSSGHAPQGIGETERAWPHKGRKLTESPLTPRTPSGAPEPRTDADRGAAKGAVMTIWVAAEDRKWRAGSLKSASGTNFGKISPHKGGIRPDLLLTIPPTFRNDGYGRAFG